MTARTFLPCSVADCPHPQKSQGFCRKHYVRFRKHGSPCGGREGTEHGVPHKYLEEVVLLFEGDECLPWPYAKSDTGPGLIWLDGRMQKVSRVVCERVNGPPPSATHQAAHSCGNGHLACCNKRHLRWATIAENQHDRIAHGTDGRGSRCGTAKLNIGVVRQIRRSKGKIKQRELAAMFGVHRVTIAQIQGGKSWAWLDGAGQ